MTAWKLASGHPVDTQPSTAAYRAASFSHWQAKSVLSQPMDGASSRKQLWAHDGIAVRATERHSCARAAPRKSAAAAPSSGDADDSFMTVRLRFCWALPDTGAAGLVVVRLPFSAGK